MKVLVIPDIHMKAWIFDRADDILKNGKADSAVCLMDIPDDWGMEFQVEKYRVIFDRAIKFSKDYPNTFWCYGNHDVSYPWGRLESGYSPYAEKTVISKLEELKASLPDPAQMAIVHRVDKVLFLHGGLSSAFVRRLGTGLIDTDIDEIVRAVNSASQDMHWDEESPLWLRPQYSYYEMFRSDLYKQVVGHTPVENIFEEDSVISTDVFSTYQDGRQIGEPAMIVIDTESGEFKKIDVL